MINVIHYPDTNSVEVTWLDADVKQTRCHSYADSQMDMLEADLGDDVAEHAALIATVRANIKPPVPPAPLSPLEELTKLEAENTLTQRNLREFILLTVEAVKQLSGGAVDLTQVRGVSVVADIEKEASRLRNKL